MTAILKRYHPMHDMNRKEDLTGFVKDLERLQTEHPAMEVYWDGDEYAIVGRPSRTAATIMQGMSRRGRMD